MAKPQKRVWVPTEYTVEVNGTEYVVSPRPIEDFIKFSDVVDSMTGKIDDMPNDAPIEEVFEVILSAPYEALSVVIPGLKEDDIRKTPLPQLKFILDLVIEVNGVQWLETFVKNSLGPLLPKLIQAAAAGVQGSAASKLSTTTEIAATVES